MKTPILYIFLFVSLIMNSQEGSVDLNFNVSDHGYKNGLFKIPASGVVKLENNKLLLWTSFFEPKYNGVDVKKIVRLNEDGLPDSF
jgi:hypothetical protein